MSRPLIKKAIASILCLGMIASTGFIFPASADTPDDIETPPVFSQDDIYYNNHLDFYNGIVTPSGVTISKSLLLIKNYKSYIQNQHNTCGNVSSMTVENYYTGCGLNEAKVASLKKAMQTGEVGGTGTQAVREYFDGLGWSTLVNYIKTDGNYYNYNPKNEAYTWPIDCDTLAYEPLEFLRNNVAAGMPTLIECSDFGGHWMTVIGYDDMGTPGFNNKDDIRDDVIIMADPGDKTDHNWDGYYVFPAARFLYEWYDDYCLIYHVYNGLYYGYNYWNIDLANTVYLWHPFVLTTPLVAKTDAPLSEDTMNNAAVHLTLKSGSFKDSTLDLNNFTIMDAPYGITVSDVKYIDSTHADINLTHHDFDKDQHVYLKIAGDELSSGTGLATILDIACVVEHSGGHGGNSTPAVTEPKAPAQPEPKVTEVNGVKTSTVELTSDFIQGSLKVNSDEITVKAANGSDKVVGRIVGALLNDMADKKTELKLVTENAQYSLPTGQLDLKDICSQFGSGVSLKDIDFNISISKPLQDVVDTIKKSSEAGGYTIVAAPVQFEITGTYQGKEVTIDKFGGYVDRYIAIADGVNPDQVSAAVVLQADGTLRSVPMKIVKIDGKSYAKISSMTNSTYALISNTTSFTDTSSHWAKNAINDLSSRLIVNGVGKNAFEPNKAITRAEFAAIIVKALGVEPKGNANFTDVKTTDWFKGYVDAASSKGLISGYSDGTFKPNQKITREEAMAIILRAMAITGIDPKLNASEVSDQLKAFSDNSSISSWAQSAVASCVKENIASGRNGNLMAPKNNITRAEICVMVQRMLQKSDLI